MLIPVLCRCGRCVSSLYFAFDTARKNKIAASAPNASPFQIPLIDQTEKAALGETLDELGVTRECCRQLLLTSIEFVP